MIIPCRLAHTEPPKLWQAIHGLLARGAPRALDKYANDVLVLGVIPVGMAERAGFEPGRPRQLPDLTQSYCHRGQVRHHPLHSLAMLASGCICKPVMALAPQHPSHSLISRILTCPVQLVQEHI